MKMVPSSMAASLSQSLGSFVIPSSERSDPDAVRSSLEQARTDFERGQVRDALLHLRRGAEAADDAGRELRAVALARAAADLATEVGSSTLTPPPTSAVIAAAPASAVVAAAPASIAAPASAAAALPLN